MPEILKEPIDDNPVTEVRKKVDGALVIEQTHQKPVTKTTTHVIAELKTEIAKYKAVIAVWQAKISPLQALVDEYEAVV